MQVKARFRSRLGLGCKPLFRLWQMVSLVLGYDRFELKSMPLQTIVKTREKTNR
jgi:hypothetical protein